MSGGRRPGWQAAAPPPDEGERLAVLAALRLLDTGPEPLFDTFVRAVARLFAAPIAFVSLIDGHRQWFKARLGLEPAQVPRDSSFCTHVLLDPQQPLVVGNACEDERFADNPLVVGPPHVRAYAGVPIRVEDRVVGTLCVLDHVSRPDFADARLAVLADLAAAAGAAIEARFGTGMRDEAAAAPLDAAALAQAVRAAGLAPWRWLRDEDRIDGDLGGLARLFGVDPAMAGGGALFRKAVHPDDRTLVDLRLGGLKGVGTPFEVRFRPARWPDCWLALHGSVIEADAQGRPLVLSGIAIDATDRHLLAMAQAGAANEMRHRLKNVLGLAGALAALTARRAQDMDAFVTAFRGRLQALAEAEMAMSADGGSRVRLARLMQAQLAAFAEVGIDRLHWTACDAWLNEPVAQVLTLVLNELATNALRHGALAMPDGTVSVTTRCLTEADTTLLDLDWVERAPGLALGDNVVAGTGIELMDRMVRSRRGTLERHWHPHGLTARLRLPLG